MSVPPANSRILYPEREVERMVDRLAVKLNVDLEGQTPVFACLLKGAIPFTWDLMRRMKVDLTLSYIRVQRFKGKVGGTPRISHFDAEEFSGQTVVVVDSVLDEGHTLEVVHEVLNPLVGPQIDHCCPNSEEDGVQGYGRLRGISCSQSLSVRSRYGFGRKVSRSTRRLRTHRLSAWHYCGIFVTNDSSTPS